MGASRGRALIRGLKWWAITGIGLAASAAGLVAGSAVWAAAAAVASMVSMFAASRVEGPRERELRSRRIGGGLLLGAAIQGVVASQVVGTEVAPWLAERVNLIITTCTWPEEWKDSLVVPCWKRKGSRASPLSYRPIPAIPLLLC